MTYTLNEIVDDTGSQNKVIEERDDYEEALKNELDFDEDNYEVVTEEE